MQQCVRGESHLGTGHSARIVNKAFQGAQASWAGGRMAFNGEASILAGHQ